MGLNLRTPVKIKYQQSGISALQWFFAVYGASEICVWSEKRKIGLKLIISANVSTNKCLNGVQNIAKTSNNVKKIKFA